jgi:hypothetical protein
MSEAEAQALLTEHLRESGFRVIEQFPIGGKHIDLVALDHNTDSSAVEVKLQEWRRALSQAFLNQSYFNYSYVALPRSFAHRIPKANLRELGLGLIVFDTSGFEIVVSAVRGDAMSAVEDRLRFAAAAGGERIVC